MTGLVNWLNATVCTAVLSVSSLALATEPAPAPTPEPIAEPVIWKYTLDPGKSKLWVVVKADRSTFVGRTFGHDHVIAATGWTGTVEWNYSDPSKCKVEIKVPVTGLVVDPSGARASQGFKKEETPEDDKKKITENFRGDTQLQASKYGDIKFSALSCSAVRGPVKVTGNLTIRGVSRKITADMNIIEGDRAFSGTGGFSILHSDFGFQPFEAVGGKMRNENALKFVLDVRGTAP